MSSFVSDFLYTFRIFFKRPGLTLLAIVALSVSLGMSTTTFSILNGMFIKPLPFKDPEELNYVYLKNLKMDSKMMPIPYDEFKTLERVESFESVMAYYSGTINVSGDSRPERYTGAFVSPNFLEVLGHEPELGLGFSDHSVDSGAEREILISHRMWKDRYHGDPDILGNLLRANGSTHKIVGVLPEGFHFPSEAEAWIPLGLGRGIGDVRDDHKVAIAVCRMRDGGHRSEANAELAELYRGWGDLDYEDKDNLRLTCESFGRMEMNDASESILIVTISSVIFILLVSCANVANLLVGRAITRGREMAIRSALGASRKRIVRQLLTESLVLSFLGAIGGLLYAAWAVDATMNSRILNLPYWMDFELDWRVFLFVLSIMIGTALVSGLVPAWQASRTDLNEMLKDTSHTSTSFKLGRLTRMLAVVQIAFSCALLFGAGLITRNTIEMNRIDPGFDPGQILTMRMGLFPEDYPSESDRDAFYEALIREVNKVPGVRGSAVSSWIGQFGNYDEPFILAGRDNPKVSYAFIESVSPGYFETMGMQILQGRGFLGRDSEDGSQVIIVNDVFVNRYLQGSDPLQKEVSMVFEKGNGRNPRQIVGVVSSVRVSNFTSPDEREAIVYRPFTQGQSQFMSLIVGSRSPSKPELLAAIQQVILKLDPHLPVYFTKTMREYMDDQIHPFRVLASFFLSIGFMALFLAAVGVYGMLVFNVSRRRREIGIRMALGADSRRIVAQVLQQGFVQVILGVAIGTGFAFLVGQLTRSFLLGINPMDPSVYIGVLLILVGAAALAFFVPARRAARLSPMEALRYE